jgi:hypothetical protein
MVTSCSGENAAGGRSNSALNTLNPTTPAAIAMANENAAMNVSFQCFRRIRSENSRLEIGTSVVRPQARCAFLQDAIAGREVAGHQEKHRGPHGPTLISPILPASLSFLYRVALSDPIHGEACRQDEHPHPRESHLVKRFVRRTNIRAAFEGAASAINDQVARAR